MTTKALVCLLAFVVPGVSCGIGAPPHQQQLPILTESPLVLSADQAEARFGRTLAGAGDVDGDGYDDLIVGSPYYDNGDPFEGRAWLFLGGNGGPEPLAAWTSESNSAEARWGRLVAGAGDVDADGYADVLVGAHFYSGYEANNGLVSVFRGGPSGLEATAGWSVEGAGQGAGLGWAADGVGDVNGDGYDDVVAGAWEEKVDGVPSGALHAWYGGPSGLSLGDPDWSVFGNGASQLGASVRGAGDVNGDGYADVIVGSPGGGFDSSYVWLGSPDGLSADPAWSATGPPDSRHGWAVASARDVNADGYDDVMVGEPGFSEGRGRVLLYLGSPSGPSATPDWEFSTDEGGELGIALGAAGDLDDDGYDDVVVGAWKYRDVYDDEGCAWLFRGGPGGLGAAAVWSAQGGMQQAYFGLWADGVGDLDGDGVDDLAVGAKQYEVDQVNEGAAFGYLSGGSSPGDDDDDTGDDDDTPGDDDDSGDDDDTVEPDDDDDTDSGPHTWRLPSDERSILACRATHGPTEARGLAWLLVALLLGRRSWRPRGPSGRASPTNRTDGYEEQERS